MISCCFRLTSRSLLRQFPASSLLNLTASEKALFSTLLSVLPNGTLRVAGGWVRDKLLGLSSQDIDLSLDRYTGVEAAKILQNSLPDTSGFGAVRLNPAASKHLETACIKIMGFALDLVHLRAETYADSRIPTVVRRK
jgi:tRNA nucleotidyltransferase (CCA-adding enzyme)